MKLKQILLALGSLTAVVAPVAAVVACGSPDASPYSEADMLKMGQLKTASAKTKLQDAWYAKVIATQDKLTASPSDILQKLSVTTLEVKQEILPLFAKSKDPLDVTAVAAIKAAQDKAAVWTAALKSSALVKPEVVKKQTAITAEETKLAPLQGLENEFKATLEFILRQELMTNKAALTSIYTQLKSYAPAIIVGTKGVSVGIPAAEALKAKLFDNSGIDAAIKTLFTGDSWKDVFYNILQEAPDADQPDDKVTTYDPSSVGLKGSIMQMLVTKRFLNVTRGQYKQALPSKYAALGTKYTDNTVFKDTTASFPLMKSLLDNRLANKWTYTIDVNKSSSKIIAGEDNEESRADALDSFLPTTGDIKLASHSVTTATALPSTTVRLGEMKDPKAAGYAGTGALPSGSKALDTSSAAVLKQYPKLTDRDGFIVDGKILSADAKDPDETTAEAPIKFVDEAETSITLTYYASLMPYYDEKKTEMVLPVATTDADKLNLLELTAIQHDQNLYTEAKAYFTTDIKDNDGKVVREATLLTVENDWARDYYVTSGMDYIDAEKDN